MSDLQLVYIAPNGLVKVRDGINMRMGRLVLASDPTVAQYPDAFVPFGMVDAATAALFPGLGDEATAKLLLDRIQPIPVEPPSERHDGPIATPEEAIAAYDKYGSDRKAASTLGISRTQLRRLRGLER